MYRPTVSSTPTARPRATAASIDLARAAALFHALSDPTRLAILARLRDGERCVCDLQDLLDAAQSRLSFHLRVLKDAGVVVDRKEGRWSYYALDPAALDEVHGAITTLRPAEARPRRGATRVIDSCCG